MPEARRSTMLAALVAALGSSTSSQGSPVVEIDFYRALQGSSIDGHTTQNDDLASLGGVLKYIHTEIIAESQEDQTRWQRKYSVDAIMKRRFKVQNPPSLGVAQTSFVDFGPFVTFDQGQSTNPALDTLYEAAGDFVGVQDQTIMPSITVSKQHPNFWFSVSGFCPNLPWSRMPMKGGTTTARCHDDGLCEAKGSPSDPASDCLAYSDTGDVVAGGLCDGGEDLNNTVPEMDPNGTHGCAYTYGKATLVYLDELVGISEQKCNGGKPCADWLDFRRNCDDASLKRMFDSATGAIKDAKNLTDQRPYCVEYDIHPACQADCESDACQQLETKEIGLPFWLGRCSPEANQHRVALLADAVGIEGALDRHRTVARDVLEKEVPCNKPGTSTCQPTIDAQAGTKGGPYCSRSFAGVCYECHVPGTRSMYRPDADTKPVCPYDILATVDYRSMAKPNCKTAKPSDVCCLYTGACEGSDDPSEASIDDEGLRLVEHRCWKEGSTDPMLRFAERVARERLSFGVLDPKSAGVQKFAYRQWGVAPGAANFSSFLAGLEQHLGPAPTPAPSPSPQPSSSGGGAPVVLIVILVILGIAALAGLGFFFYRRQLAARQPPLLNGGAAAV